MAYPYVLTGNSIVVTLKDRVVTVQQGAPNYTPLREALMKKNWTEVDKNLDISSTITNWSKGDFELQDNTVTYKGEPLPEALTQRLMAMTSRGESPEPLMKFWAKLQQNPSWRSVQQLYPFLQHQGIPFTKEGNFLAYKGVKDNYTDKYTGKNCNKPGTIHEMPRNKISDDPDQACHYGLHVGDLTYARNFAAVVVICEVDPADVVCIPKDSSARKMRVCRYKVIGNHNGEYMPSTSFEVEEDLGKGTELEHDEDEEFEPHKIIEDNEKALAESDNTVIKDLVKKAQPREKKLKKQRANDKTVKLKIPREFKKIHTMQMKDLLDQSLGELRTYASRVLHIVGASKIPGGKVTLAQQIIKTRKSFR